MNADLYTLLPSCKQLDDVGALAAFCGNFHDVVGYSSLGDIFLRDPDTNEYAVVYLQRHGFPAKKYGPYDTIERFRDEVLEDKSFAEYCLKPEAVAELRSRVGALDDSEVYFPQPFPCLGGSGELSTYSKGNVWVYFDILGQSVD